MSIKELLEIHGVEAEGFLNALAALEPEGDAVNPKNPPA